MRSRNLMFALACTLACLNASAALPPNNDFDQVMNNVGSESIWAIIAHFNVLPEDFSLDPETCDVNGGLNSSIQPVEMYPNGILDSDELALMGAILSSPGFDCSGYGGTSYQEIYDAWEHNYAQVWHDLGGGVGGPERLLPPESMIKDIEYLFCAFMTLGDSDTLSFPLTVMDLIVNNETANSLFNDPNLHMPDPALYKLMYRYLAWCGDADGDGCNNLHEYQYYYPTGQRAGFIKAAMDPFMVPPDFKGIDEVCDDNGGLWGEYYNEKDLTNLALTRVDKIVDFDWKTGSPAPNMDGNDFSARWTGWVRPAYSEVYTFFVRSDDGVRLWVNGETLVNDWTLHGRQEFSGQTSYTMVAGEQYFIRMEFFEQGGDANAWLGWSSASQRKSVIADMYLTPWSDYKPDDWVRNPWNGHYYRVTPSMPWADARALAHSPAWGGYLVTINNEIENKWLQQMFGLRYSNPFIGANDLQNEGAWVWDENGAQFWSGAAAGSLVAPYTYAPWNSGEPNDSSNNEDAAQLYSGTGLWNDMPASRSFNAIVESEMPHLLSNPIEPANATATEGDRFSFKASVRRPVGQVTYRWKKNGHYLDEAKGYASRDIGQSSVFTIYDVTAEDQGYYSCECEDETGAVIEAESVSLTVQARTSPLPAASPLGLMALSLLVTSLAVRKSRKA